MIRLNVVLVLAGQERRFCVILHIGIRTDVVVEADQLVAKRCQIGQRVAVDQSGKRFIHDLIHDPVGLTVHTDVGSAHGSGGSDLSAIDGILAHRVQAAGGHAGLLVQRAGLDGQSLCRDLNVGRGLIGDILDVVVLVLAAGNKDLVAIQNVEVAVSVRHRDCHGARQCSHTADSVAFGVGQAGDRCTVGRSSRLRRHGDILDIDGEQTTIMLRLVCCVGITDPGGNDLAANIGAFDFAVVHIRGSGDSFALCILCIELAAVVFLLSTIVDQILIRDHDLDFLLLGSECQGCADLLCADAALQRNRYIADTGHGQQTVLRNGCRAGGDLPSQNAGGVVNITGCGFVLVAVGVELDDVAIVGKVSRAVTVFDHAADLEIRLRVFARHGHIAVHIADGIVPGECGNRDDLVVVADLIACVVGVVRIVDQLRLDLNVAQRGIRRNDAGSETLKGSGQIGISAVLLAGDVVRCDGQRLGRDLKGDLLLVCGVVCGFTHMDGRNILADLGGSLIGNALNGAAGVGDVGLGGAVRLAAKACIDRAVIAAGGIFHAGLIRRRGELGAGLDDGVDAVSGVGHAAVRHSCLDEVAACGSRSGIFPSTVIVVARTCGTLCRSCGNAGGLAVVDLDGVADGDETALGAIVKRTRCIGVADIHGLGRAALVVVLLGAGDDGVLAHLVHGVDLFHAVAVVVIVGHFIVGELVARLIDEVNVARGKLDVLAGILVGPAGDDRALDLAALNVEFLSVAVTCQIVVRRVVAHEGDVLDAEICGAGSRLTGIAGADGIDAVAVDDALTISGQTGRRIDLSVVQDDLLNVGVGGAVVDLGLRDEINDTDLTRLDRKGGVDRLFGPVSGLLQADGRIVGAGLRRLDLLRAGFIRVVVDHNGLLRQRVFDAHIGNGYLQALHLAVINGIVAGHVERVVVVADDERAGDLLVVIAVGECGLDLERVVAGGHVLVPVEAHMAVDIGFFSGKDRGDGSSRGRNLCRFTGIDVDGQLADGRGAGRTGGEGVDGDGLTLNDALIALARVVGVDVDRQRCGRVRRHENVGVVDLTAVVLICCTDRALINLFIGTLGDRRIIHGDDRAVSRTLLHIDLAGRAGGAGDVRPRRIFFRLVRISCRVGQHLPLDGVVRVVGQLGQGNVMVERVDLAELQVDIALVGKHLVILSVDVDATFVGLGGNDGSLVLDRILHIHHGGVDGDGVVVRRAASGSRDGVLFGSGHRGAGVEGLVALVDGGDLDVLLGVVTSLDRQLIGLDAGGHNACDLCKAFGITNLSPSSTIVYGVVEGHGAGGLHGGGSLLRSHGRGQGDIVELVNVGFSGAIDLITGFDSHGDVLLLADDGLLGVCAGLHVARRVQADIDLVADLVVAGLELTVGGGGSLRVVTALGDPLNGVVLCRNGTAVERDDRPVRLGIAGAQLEFVLHACQQAGQVIGVGGRLIASVVCQRRINDRGLDGGGLDVDGLGRSLAVAGVIGGVGQIDGVELVLVFGYALTVSPLADLHLTGRNAVCTDRNGGGVQQRVSRTLAVEVDKTGGDSGGPGSRIRDLRGQCDLLALELGEMLSGEDVVCTVDLHICGFIISAGDFQRGGGGLLLGLCGRLGDQIVPVDVLDHGAVLVVRRSFRVDAALRRRDLRAEGISGIFRRDLHPIGVAGRRIRGPVVCGILIFPRDLVVRANAQLRYIIVLQVQAAVQFVDRRDLEPIGAVGGHLIGRGGARLVRVDGQLVLRFDPVKVCFIGLLVDLPGDGLGIHAKIVRGIAGAVALVRRRLEFDLVIPTIVALCGCIVGVAPLVILYRRSKHAVIAAVDRRCAEEGPVCSCLGLLVERHRALRISAELADQRDAVALVGILEFAAGNRSSRRGARKFIGDDQLCRQCVGLPDGIEGSVLGELDG